MKFLIVIVIALLIPLASWALPEGLPGTTALTYSAASLYGPVGDFDECKSIKPGDICYYSMGPSSGNSKTFHVHERAYFCYFRLVAGTTNTSQTIVYVRFILPGVSHLTQPYKAVITPIGTGIQNPLQDAGQQAAKECFNAGPGTYYFDFLGDGDAVPAVKPDVSERPGIVIYGVSN